MPWTGNYGDQRRGVIQHRPVRLRKYPLMAVLASGLVILATASSASARPPAAGQVTSGKGSIAEAAVSRSPAGSLIGSSLFTLSSIDNSTAVPCAGIQGRTCSWRVYFSNINDAIQFYGLSVLTIP